MKKNQLIFCLMVAAFADLGADVVAEFDVATGADTPLMAAPPWILEGEAMENSEGKLVQHVSPPPERGTYSHYISPELGGLISGTTNETPITRIWSSHGQIARSLTTCRLMLPPTMQTRSSQVAA